MATNLTEEFHNNLIEQFRTMLYAEALKQLELINNLEISYDSNRTLHYPGQCVKTLKPGTIILKTSKGDQSERVGDYNWLLHQRPAISDICLQLGINGVILRLKGSNDETPLNPLEQPTRGGFIRDLNLDFE